MPNHLPTNALQAVQLKNIQYYHFFRVLFSLVILLAALFDQQQVLPLQSKNIITPLIVVYFMYSQMIYFGLLKDWALPRTVFHLAIIDFIFIFMLMIFSSPINFLLSIISIMIVLISAILIPLKRATVLVLIAIITLSVSHILHYIFFKNIQPFLSTIALFFLSFTFVTIAFSTRYLREELFKQQALIRHKTQEAQQLTALNALILDKMRTGILVSNHNHQLVLFNNHSSELLGIKLYKGIHLKTIHTHLCSLLHENTSPNQTLTMNRKEIKISISSINYENERLNLFYLEDNAKIIAKAQEYKLSSLGRLTASIAHEIRNPLSAISYANTCISEDYAKDSEDLTQLNTIISKNITKIDQIIKDVLDLSRPKQTNVSQLSLHSWLTNFIESFQESYPHPIHIENHCNTDLKVMFDTNALNMVLTNIVDNGLFYSHKKTGQYQLKLLTQETTQGVSLIIQDFGDGIAQENHTAIFEPFFTQKHGGTGLGLYISRELCQANGATIHYDNTPPYNSHFTITFSPKKGT